MYLPRSTKPGFRLEALSVGYVPWPWLDCEVLAISNSNAMDDVRMNLFIVLELGRGGRVCRNALRPQDLVDEKQVGEKGPHVDRSI